MTTKQLYAVHNNVRLFIFYFNTLYRASCIILHYNPTNAQLSHKLAHSYMFRHYRVILRELVINTLPSYTSISNVAVGNTIYS